MNSFIICASFHATESKVYSLVLWLKIFNMVRGNFEIYLSQMAKDVFKLFTMVEENFEIYLCQIATNVLKWSNIGEKICNGSPLHKVLWFSMSKLQTKNIISQNQTFPDKMEKQRIFQTSMNPDIKYKKRWKKMENGTKRRKFSYFCTTNR